MTFSALAEAFISLLCHCHNIEPRVMINGEPKQRFEDVIKPSDLNLLIRDDNFLETAFRPTSRAVEMAKQMAEEQIPVNYAIGILKELKSEYWLDNYYPSLSHPVKAALEDTYVSEYHPIASEEEIKSVTIEYLEHCDKKREAFYSILMSILSGESKQPESDTRDKKPTDLRQILSDKGLKNFDTLLNSLMNTDPPLLSNDRRWIGKPKNAICLWLDTLHQRGYIDGRHSNETLSRVVCNEFEGLSISPSSFDKAPYLRAEQMYNNQFKRLIP